MAVSSPRACYDTDSRVATEAMQKFNIEKVGPEGVFPAGTVASLCSSRTSPSTSRRRQVCTDNTPTHQPLTCTQFDSRKGATWHCIVGRNFGSFVTHGKSGHDTLSNAPHANIPRRNQALHLLLPGPLRNPALQDSVSNMNDGPLGSDVSERRWIPCICFGLYAQTIWLVTHTFARM